MDRKTFEEAKSIDQKINNIKRDLGELRNGHIKVAISVESAEDTYINWGVTYIGKETGKRTGEKDIMLGEHADDILDWMLDTLSKELRELNEQFEALK